MALEYKSVKHNDENVLVKAEREALGKSQRWLAWKVGITAPTLSRFEIGTEKLRRKTLNKIWKVFDQERKFRAKAFNQPWLEDFIELKKFMIVVEMCQYNPLEQKKAYEALENFLQHITNKKDLELPKWNLEVDDPAFGRLNLYNDKEKSK